ncbi:chemotaxis protein CheD [Niallia endozanthoxylica]|uniref:Probable chemoreceptor glutamine deamidase CheD n=1 Tax=Niallia endozanthoxylica TaxID=2036016 RepID=A0A5J5HVY7_9BACI|nr:chemotaxis protein CheD [Niallia endozanthoxylica]KAA9025853.1 chemotaxis protein CheD [Niallia endozanthoxylica]
MNNLQQIVRVGIADMNIVKAPNLIRTSGLGSCVGVVVYDPYQQIAGLAHIMLPDSSLAKNGSMTAAKYADTAVNELVACLVKHGARKTALKAKIAGGAQMFQFSSGNELMRIGPRNVEAVKKQLASFHIEIVGEDVGGNNGRTIEFDPKTYLLHIKTVNRGITYL